MKCCGGRWETVAVQQPATGVELYGTVPEGTQLRHTHIVPPGYHAVPLEIFGEPVGKRVVDLEELVKKCGR